ncbi:amidohydrolase family protein [Nonomuraea dietziae]|uniref:amidohydrolase family protein n=1 Tax=Nonomuraea dietziae TaxID=65515 RepID=UPI0031D19B9F
MKRALGTDSLPARHDPQHGLRNNLAKARHRAARRVAGSAADYYRAATLSGARASLGRDDLEGWRRGAKADLVVVDLSRPAHRPRSTTRSETLLMNCSGADVTTVVIDGRVVHARRGDPRRGREGCSWRGPRRTSPR